MMTGLVISLLSFYNFTFRDFRVPSVCCAVEPQDALALMAGNLLAPGSTYSMMARYNAGSM